MRKFEYKVPNGKLICAKIQVNDNRITNLQISGDFFLLPETDLEDLESQLIGMKTDIEAIKIKVTSFFTKQKTTIVGASPEDFAHVINSAISS
jgi:lipoate-protein ligase A